MNATASLDVLTAVPVTVLTGFLGAGKTTLLNRILNGDHGLRVAVLVNDFGSINIDAEFVVGVESEGGLISLANGCVCCNLRDDLTAAVFSVMSLPEPPEYIVLEASGVAEPSGIASTFMDARLRDRLRLDSLLCLVDASQVFAVPELTTLKLRQIAYADMLVLTKVDLVSRDEIARVREWLDEHFHRYRLVGSAQGGAPLEILLSAGRLDATQSERSTRPLSAFACEDEGEAGGRAPAFDTWSCEIEQPLALDALREVARRLPTSIYRCKGVIHTTDAPDRRAILQVVGKRVDIAAGKPWGHDTPASRIVVIGATGGVDARVLDNAFRSCIAR